MPKHTKKNKSMTNEQKKQAEAEFAQRAANVTDEDVEDVLGKQRKVEDIVRHVGALQKYWEDVKTFFSMVKDYVGGDYREVPFRTIAAIVGALMYVLSPIDAIPDFIPVLGYLDDGGVLALCLKAVQGDVDDYRQRQTKRLAELNPSPKVRHEECPPLS